ncbi:hypothetical protein CRUP_004178, partial [Coryphaenoides rupestris]
MAQEDPLYDFPEPAPSSTIRRDVHHRAKGSLKSVSVLDRLLLTLPVWLQLSINPATALHILQREPPGQFGIREQHSTFCLESSAISFPDLPRLIAFYCVSRDVLPFPLELPEAIAKATSHKQLESISHMGIEFWSSQLNYRGPRETPKAKDQEEKESGTTDKSSTTPASQLPSTATPDSLPQTHPSNQLGEPPQNDSAAGSQSKTSPTVFQKLCPITTRSPRELNCGPGLGALCFVNPLFLQSQSGLHRRHLFKRSLKVRVSTETTSYLSPPIAPPPPPPLMPKTRGKCKAKLRTGAQDPQGLPPSQTSAGPGEHSPGTPTKHIQGDPVQPQDAPMEAQPGVPGPGGREEEEDPAKDQIPVEVGPIPAGLEDTDSLQDESEYMEPSQEVNINRHASPTVSPYLTPAPSPRESPSPFLKVSPSLSPHNSTSVSPMVSPSHSPKLPFSLSPFASPYISPYVSPTAEDPYHVPCSTPLRLAEKDIAVGDQELGDCERKEDHDDETIKDGEEEEVGLLLEQLYASNLNDPECCDSLSSSEGEEEENLLPSPLPQLA